MDGVYRLHYVRTSGGCADIPDRLVRFGDDSADDPGCTGSDTVRDDGCTVETEGTCTEVNASGVKGIFKATGVFTQTSDKTFEGTFSLSASNSIGDYCSSIYDVSGTRQ